MRNNQYEFRRACRAAALAKSCVATAIRYHISQGIEAGLGEQGAEANALKHPDVRLLNHNLALAIKAAREIK